MFSLYREKQMEIDQSSLKDAKTQALDQFGFGVLYV